MQEYRDGTFGEVKPMKDLFKDLLDSEEELTKTSAIHIGSEEELKQKRELAEIVRFYGSAIKDVQDKLDKIIKHFKIYDTIGG